MNPSPNHAYFLFALLALLDDKIKERITFFLDKRLLDGALYEMFKRKKFPDWFAEEFSYDPLYGQSDSLRWCIVYGMSRLLAISIEVTGAGSFYRLKIGESDAESFVNNLGRLGVTLEQVKDMAEVLSRYLLEKEEEEKKKQKPV